MSSFSIAVIGALGRESAASSLGAPGGGTGAGDSSLCYEGDIHVPHLQIHPPLRTRIHRTLGGRETPEGNPRVATPARTRDCGAVDRARPAGKRRYADAQARLSFRRWLAAKA